MARSSFSHWLVGLSSSVLKDEFVSSYRHDDSLDGVEPFSGKLMLPTKLQTLKLHFFLKDAKGRKDSNVTPGEITSKVSGLRTVCSEDLGLQRPASGQGELLHKESEEEGAGNYEGSS